MTQEETRSKDSDARRIAAETVRGSAYSISSSAVTLTLGFLRAVLLARLLLPQDFGLMALAVVYIGLAGNLRAFGLSQAMIHHPHPEEATYRTYFSLRFGTTVVSILVLIAALPLLSRAYPEMPGLAQVVGALTVLQLLHVTSVAQEALLARAMAFRTLAITDVLASVVMTCCAPLAAWNGWGVWALVIEPASGMLTRTIYVWRTRADVRPRFGWDGADARWFWNYGRPSWAVVNLTSLLNQFDDFWVGTVLGRIPLGYYSRAYEFARYPRRVIASPLLDVFFSTFARLQHDRRRLSQAYYRVTSLMVRIGFWFSLIFILAAPEFIRLLLGERWLPMTLTFQLMVGYTLMDPFGAGVNQLLMATGHPEAVLRLRVVQLLVFVPAVVLLSRAAGIAGVALAADLMVFAGDVFIFRYSRRLVDYSARALFLWPATALVVTAALILLLHSVWAGLSPWAAFFGKVALICLCYPGLLWLVEREQLVLGWRVVWRHLAAVPAMRRAARRLGWVSRDDRDTTEF